MVAQSDAVGRWLRAAGRVPPASAYQVIATIAYPKIKHIIEQTCASGLIYLNSHAIDFKSKAIRP